MKWYKYGTGSRSWAFDDGYILIDKPDNLGLVESIEYPGGGFKYFTVGLPSSAHHALQDWGAALEAARDRFCIPVPVLFAMAAIESTRAPFTGGMHRMRQGSCPVEDKETHHGPKNE